MVRHEVLSGYTFAKSRTFFRGSFAVLGGASFAVMEYDRSKIERSLSSCCRDEYHVYRRAELSVRSQTVGMDDA